MPRRRDKGSGSVYPVRQDGRIIGWRANVTLPDGRRVSPRAATRDEARTKLRRLLADVERGVYDERQTLAVYLKRWLTDTVALSRRPATLETYEAYIRLHVLPTLGHLRLGQLAPAHLRRLETTLLQKRSPTTVRLIHSILRVALAQAERDGLVARNPAALVVPPSPASYQPGVLSAEQVTAILRALPGQYHGPLWTFLLGTGCRFGEAAALWWEDLDLAGRAVALNYTLTWPPAEPGQRRTWARSETKTDRSRRVVPLPSFVMAALRTLPRQTPRAFVFTAQRGGPVRESPVLRAWHALLEDLGIGRRRLHDVRHCVASLLIADGAEMRQVGDLLGHANLAVTDTVYVARSDVSLRRLAERLDTLFTLPENADAGS